MGSGGAKTTNRMLAEQTGRSNQLADLAGTRSANYYNQVSGLPGEILGHYRGMLSGTEGGIGGGGGGGGVPWSSSTMPFYRGMMDEGGYSEADKANILSYATGPISGIFEGLARKIAQQRAGSGSPVYSGSLGRLARDQAYETSHAAKGVAGDLAEKILANRFRGAEGVRGLEKEKRAHQSSMAARRASANARDFGQRMAVLSAMGNYVPGSDTDYFDRSLASTGQATGAVTSRANETPMWQRAFANVIPAAAGAAVGSFGGGGGYNRGGNNFRDYNVTASPEERRYMDY